MGSKSSTLFLLQVTVSEVLVQDPWLRPKAENCSEASRILVFVRSRPRQARREGQMLRASLLGNEAGQ